MSGGGVRTAPTLVTQFAVPPPPFGMVERPRLSERVHRGLEEPVTFVCAPAGSGKTALVASQVPDAAWITLEAADDEPGRLWGAVLTALEIAGAVPPDSSLAALAAAGAASRATRSCRCWSTRWPSSRGASCSCSTTSTSCARASA